MVLKKISYGLIPVRKAKSKRIQKKWNKKYGLRIGVKGIKNIPVPPAKEEIYKSFKDLVPADPDDEFWAGVGEVVDGKWRWHADAPILPLETLIRIKKKLEEENSISGCEK